MPYALLYIDHMRDKKGYIDCLDSFSSLCDVRGILRPTPKGSYDLLLLCDQPDSIGKYVQMLKSTKIDVDSKGRRCKEKQSRVLIQSQAPVEMGDPTLKVLACGDDLLSDVEDSQHIREAIREVMK